jgi:phenylacetate-CoA ligase
MSFIESLYEKSPVTVQNLLISLKGWQFNRERFSGGLENKLNLLAGHEAMSRDEAASLQVELLRDFVAHATSTSSVYAAAFAKAKVGSDQINKLEDLRRLPVLEKEVLRSRTQELKSSSATGYLVPIHTSGTTGTPITAGFTLQDTRMRMAMWERVHNWYGVSRNDRSVRFSGRTLFPNADHNRIFWRHNHAANQMLMSSYHLASQNLDEYLDAIERFQPALIDGYPSSLYVLARHALASGNKAIRPKLAMTTAETLEDFQRETISEAFGCPVKNQYGSSEGAPIACEDEAGQIALFPCSGIIEIVKPGSDEPVKDGEEGEMLVTCFHTHAYPLIRYRIGDTGILDGYTRLRPGFRCLARISGRQEDYVVSPERGPVGRLDPVFKKSPSSIVETQIVQTAPDTLQVRYVPDPATFRDGDISVVRKELQLRVGNMKIDFVAHEGALPRGANGKLRAVVGLPGQNAN